MGEETARLREEIEQTREDLTRDVDRLAEKTSPSRIVERRVQRTRGRLVDLKEKIMGSSDNDPSRHHAGYGPSATYGPTYTQDVYSPEYATGGGSEGAVRHAVGGARDQVAHAGERVAHAGERAQGAARGAVSGVREQAEGSPLAAGVVAFGIGWLVSSLMPASDAETHAAHRAGDLAREHGGPALDQARQAAQDVGSDLREHAQEAAEHVKDRTQEAAGRVREEARSSAPA